MASGAPITQHHLDNAIAPLKSDLQSIGKKIDEHLIHSAKQDQRLEGALDVTDRVRELEHWRIEITTYGRLLKLTFGGTVLGAVIGILNLVQLAR